MTPLKILKLHPHAILPTYATAGAACFDIYSIEAAPVRPGGAVTVSTGIAFEVPPGKAMMIYSRSGHGFKNSIRLANCTGVIDSDFRGELKVRLACDSGFGLSVKPGDRIAQAMLVDAPQYPLEFTDQLSDTARGTGGFGSTGA